MINDLLLKAQDITNQITFKTGFSLADGKLFKQGKHIFGNLNIRGSLTANTSVQDFMTIPYTIVNSGNVFYGTTTEGNDQWGMPNGFCYLYTRQSGGFNVISPINTNYVRVHIDIVVN